MNIVLENLAKTISITENFHNTTNGTENRIPIEKAK